MAPSTKKAAALKVTPLEVLAAIESLYADQVQPQGRILLKRLGERAAAARAGQVALGSIPGLAVGSEVVPRLDTAHIRKVCERCPRIQVVAEAGTEYSALLVGRVPNFIDPCSNDDPFPERLWSEMAAFFGSYQNRGMRLPGGRYACARALAATRLPSLAGRSLGEVCHIVQLAVSKRQVLGYLDGHVVPYFQSQAVVKQHSAVLQQPAWSLKKGTMAVADIVQARECLRAILAGSSEAGVPLPNVKRLFRSQFQLELSETALGHCRISDLLQDVRFQDICTLQLRGSTYVVVQCQDSASEVNADLASVDQVADDAAGTPTQREQEQHSFWQSSAARTFVHLKSSPTTLLRRSSSVPKDHGFGQSLDSSPSDSVSTEATESDSPTPRRLRFCPDEPLSLDEASSAESGSSSLGFPLMTPSPQYEMPCYGARCLVATESEGRAAVSNAIAGGAAQPDAPLRRVQFCPDEPLSLEGAFRLDAETTSNFAVVTPSPQYAHPQRSWMPVACSAGNMAEVPRATGWNEPAEACDTISLFRSLGLVEISTVEAITEACEGGDGSGCERTPMLAEPLSLDDDDVVESQALLGFPLMTPSPAYHEAASLRYASLRSGQQFRRPQGQADFPAEAQFENFPCALQQHGLSFDHQPRLAAVGGA